MTKVITRTGKGAAITQAENDANLDSFCGINDSQTGTTYTVTEDDQNNIIEFTNASTVTVALTLISTLISAIDTSDFAVTLKNIGAGSVVVTPTTNTFDDGVATKTLSQYEWITIQTNNAQDKWNVITSSDASKVDGLNASQFLRSDADDTTTGNVTVEKADPETIMNATSGNAATWFRDSGTNRALVYWDRGSDALNLIQYDSASPSTINAEINITEGGKVNIATGTLQLAGADVTATAAELNLNNIVTVGTVQISRTVTADSSGDVNFPSGTDLKIQNVGLLDLVYPVGAIYISTANTEPSSILGGTWTSVSTGATLISQNGSFAAGTSYGQNTQAVHSHPDSFSIDNSTQWSLYQPGGAGIAAINAHSHGISGGVSNNSAVTNDNMQLSLAVYMWERTA